MLQQTSAEALLSAAYVENYLDCIENLPNDLQRHLSRMRELDVTYRECVRDAQRHLAICVAPNTEEKRRGRAALRLQAALVTAQEIGDEKLQVVQVLQDLIDNKQRALDADHKKLVSCLEINSNASSSSKKEASPPVEAEQTEKESLPPQQQSLPPPTPPEKVVEKEKEPDKPTGERWSKRARRLRNNAGANTDGADSSERDSEQKPTTTQTHKKGFGKKKKRKARQSAAAAAARRSATPPEEANAIDPDEPRYCLCDQISFGEMILCDNDLCPIEWFHFSCVSLNTKPKGKWFCPKCRGDRPNVMKPKGQFLKELERYNREKEEKA